MSPGEAARLSEAVPRYTSYPTAPHFHDGIGPDAVAGWISGISPGEAISLYLHVPFCDRLCWFCACHTKQTLRYEPVARFLDALHIEIRTVAALLDGNATVGALHFGGGSPTMLRPHDLRRLMAVLRENLPFPSDPSISVEIDPNDMDDERLDALADIGLTRTSLGIQDFNPAVQRAINRRQSFETTCAVIEGLRQRGVRSVNFDLLYGLPHQTVESVVATVDSALSLRPDRVALFGYAHVPWFKKHQTMIDEAALPQARERLEQLLAAADVIRRAGYVAVGIDHFARPDDALARALSTGRLRRNFQGYTDDPNETLIGLGPSSISRYREGYAQNVVATGRYEECVRFGRLPVAKGIALSEDDRARAWVIERLMCDFAFPAAELPRRFGEGGARLVQEAADIARRDSFLDMDGERFTVPMDARPLVRTIAARFDRYLATGKSRHSVAV